MMRRPNPEVRTNVPSHALSHVPDLVLRYNRLNRLIVHGLPEMARAYDTVARHLPMLRQMQALLSQRPDRGHSRVVGFTMRMAVPAVRPEEIPTWSQWIGGYAHGIGYSVRQIRRWMANEPRRKTVKECGWSQTDHNNLIRAATLAFDLVAAIEHGADTVALVDEVKGIMGRVPKDILDRPYEPKRLPRRRRPARLVTE